MPEPTTTAAIAVTGAGITLFGAAIGLHPGLLLAGFCGAAWQMIESPPEPLARAVSIATVSTFVAAYATPPAMVALTALPFWPTALTGDLAQHFAAAVIGRLAHCVIGPGLARVAEKKSREIDP